jgi:Polysaccharide lyase family 4, domain II
MIVCLRRTLMAVLVPVLCVGVGQAAHAYEEVPITDGGTLTGTVKLIGDVPKPKGYNLITSPDSVYCGRISNGAGWRLLQPFHIEAQGAFRDVVVMLEEVAKGKPISFQTPRIEAIDCTFKPFISVVWDKRPVEVVNMDPVFHDIQAYETSPLGPRVLFNNPLLMYPGYMKANVTKAGRLEHRAGEALVQNIEMYKGRRVFVMQCGFHAYMESWGLVIDHPYYAVTDKEGHFKIGDIPPGTYKVVVWHPMIRGGSGEEYKVTIKSKETTMLMADIHAPTGRLYANQMEDNPRFGLGIMGDTQIVPSVEKQTY